MSTLLLLLVGLVAGVLSGLFGIGGGLVIVPGLMLVAGMEFKAASGTSLAALILPTGLLGAMQYYRANLVDVRAALLIAAGLFVGAFFGAKLMLDINPLIAKRAYACFLFAMGARLLFSSR